MGITTRVVNGVNGTDHILVITDKVEAWLVERRSDQDVEYSAIIRLYGALDYKAIIDKATYDSYTENAYMLLRRWAYDLLSEERNCLDGDYGHLVRALIKDTSEAVTVLRMNLLPTLIRLYDLPVGAKFRSNQFIHSNIGTITQKAPFPYDWVRVDFGHYTTCLGGDIEVYKVEDTP